MIIRCIGCGEPITQGHEIRKLAHTPRLVEAGELNQPWQQEPLVGYACTPQCGRGWMRRQRVPDLLRIAVSQATALSEVG